MVRNQFLTELFRGERKGTITRTLSDFHLLKSKLLSELGFFGGIFFGLHFKKMIS